MSNDITSEFEAFIVATMARTQRALNACICGNCGSNKMDPETDFKDDISRRESKISALCQKCQDIVFAPENDENEEDC